MAAEEGLRHSPPVTATPAGLCPPTQHALPEQHLGSGQPRTNPHGSLFHSPLCLESVVTPLLAKAIFPRTGESTVPIVRHILLQGCLSISASWGPQVWGRETAPGPSSPSPHHSKKSEMLWMHLTTLPGAHQMPGLRAQKHLGEKCAALSLSPELALPHSVVVRERVCVCFVPITCWEQEKNTTSPMPHSSSGAPSLGCMGTGRRGRARGGVGRAPGGDEVKVIAAAQPAVGEAGDAQCRLELAEV